MSTTSSIITTLSQYLPSITASTTLSGNVYNLLFWDSSSFWRSYPNIDSYFILDFHNNESYFTGYRIMTYTTTYLLKGWLILGSNDGVNYQTIDTQNLTVCEYNYTLSGPGRICTTSMSYEFYLATPAQFRYIKMQMNVKGYSTDSNGWCFGLCAFDMIGQSSIPACVDPPTLYFNHEYFQHNLLIFFVISIMFVY